MILGTPMTSRHSAVRPVKIASSAGLRGGVAVIPLHVRRTTASSRDTAVHTSQHLYTKRPHRRNGTQKLSESVFKEFSLGDINHCNLV